MIHNLYKDSQSNKDNKNDNKSMIRASSPTTYSSLPLYSLPLNYNLNVVSSSAWRTNPPHPVGPPATSSPNKHASRYSPTSHPPPTSTHPHCIQPPPRSVCPPNQPESVPGK